HSSRSVAMGQFGVSQPVLRREDQRLITGQGRFVDDMVPDGRAHGFVLRSPYGHARVVRVDTSAAEASPGVLAVMTGADDLGALPCISAPPVKQGTVFVRHDQPVLAVDRARYVGDPVAFVVAETLAQARDAAELIEVDYDPLPAAVGCGAAAQPGAPAVWDDTPDNTSFIHEMGDKAATEAAFADAAHVVSLDVVNNRIVQNAIEPRSAVGMFDQATGRFTLTTGTQMPNAMKTALAEVFNMDADRFRVLVEDVGGGFGGKNSLFPEQILVLEASRRLGRPVTWLSERSEAFISDYHGRDNVTRGELAFDADGRMLAIRVRTYADLGAYTAARGTVSPINGLVMMSGTYQLPAMHVEVHGVYTNTVPTDPYRGAGRPEVTYMLERLVDLAAVELGIDRIELRRRNLIQPDAFPYASPTGLNYDLCHFERIMDAAMDKAEWATVDTRRSEAAARGKLRGIGMANYVERCGGGAGLGETAKLTFDADGSVTLYIGSMANGQAHETAFSQVVNERLGLPFEKIRIVEGDTDLIATGTGTGGSWSIPMGGGAVSYAADKVVEKARRIAAHILEAAEADLEFDNGQFTVAGTDVRVSLEDVARASFDPARLPADTEPGLEGEDRFVPDNYTFPYGCHIAEVEIDRETGAIALVGYKVVHDFGRALNPLLLAGQVHGGVTQGIGQALLEHTAYDAEGQLLAGSYMDYGLPRADDLPPFFFENQGTPTERNPLGVKGCGEAGATGAPPAVMNAVIDALKPLGIRHIDMPATPEKVWAAIRKAETQAPSQ
ncbi:MAG: xanthine dehydrogenase family protein molybdopterin-binding subunit, partial [Minwuiales bacterium]|nr:xanthine dehydrogenase family protein molybdopterin-binding subunit [Minwuiales bacterium]